MVRSPHHPAIYRRGGGEVKLWCQMSAAGFVLLGGVSILLDERELAQLTILVAIVFAILAISEKRP